MLNPDHRHNQTMKLKICIFLNVKLFFSLYLGPVESFDYMNEILVMKDLKMSSDHVIKHIINQLFIYFFNQSFV